MSQQGRAVREHAVSETEPHLRERQAASSWSYAAARRSAAAVVE